jgi:beta-aspartyl-peptidase (threonine type)
MHKYDTFLTVVLVLMVAASAVPQTSSPGAINDQIRVSLAVTQVLGSQMKAWNDHDLDAFMAGYWKSAELTFFSGANEKRGWQATIDRYKATYQSPGHEMGKLEFSNMRVEALGAAAAFVRGEWRLTMSDGKTRHGLFTLVFRKFPDGWKIIHDHTSVAE